ncbi:MAG: UDP-N-acetylglucosamine--N-acetylmuramyl-(pentapeptide) pyrophosphoryl-undecaprenol N-acetylglucosamine transferase [Spirochaetales bacterium]|nr:UDP-N-acetylglucosamine--N-acetylmuramyl-(pentapeptide) pyrophosphoryl-undecaprenol N-acetylglucosamine transferase [Exilispira sp.]NMC66906.1 UDP-N-acetylglucosamine--N-acetylmuramyl-(pentapeptide) pyrophosphoryl-undecaprenol N-acetylglucosamine transferase [Spirochaetales bacterium]
MKKAVIVGGGTGGHIIPAIVVALELEKKGYMLKWIGSIKSKNLEEKIIHNYFSKIEIYHIPSGKLRRKKNIFLTIFNIKNILDIFQILFGTIYSIFILIKQKPNFVFSKGGFVSVPVAFACKILKIRFYTHESDYTVGLANKINLYFSKKFFYSFKDTIKMLPQNKSVFSSNPVRSDFFENNIDIINCIVDDNIKNFLERRKEKLPLILVLGGSLGSLKINEIILKILPQLCNEYYIIHQTGDNKKLEFSNPRYFQISFISKDVSNCMKLSSIIISRSGANLVFEIVATGKPAIFIPLKSASRGEQVSNANYFALKSPLYSVLDEDEIDSNKLLNEIKRLTAKSDFNRYDKSEKVEFDEIKIRAEKIIVDTIEEDLSIK